MNEPAKKMIRLDEYPQVERRAGDLGARPGAASVAGPTHATVELSMALPRNFPETDIRVRCIT
jgi:hypothetical protein